MNSLKITPSKLYGNINAVPSKSVSHRLMIAASLAQGVSNISNVLKSEDLEATIGILKNLGIMITSKGNNYTIIGNTFYNSSISLNANESGSTLRFFIPITWYISGSHTFIGNNTLARRPLNVYEKIAKQFGYSLDINDGEFPIITRGPIKPGNYIIDGSVSSQFITGLLFVLPLLNGSSKISFTKKLASASYIDLTLDTLIKAGIKIKVTELGYEILGNQKYDALNEVVEGDYSQAAFFLIAGLLNDNITIKNLNTNSLQGDMEILNIIKKANGKLIIKDNKITTSKSELEATIIDLYNIPDLGPILMVMAAKSKGITTFLNVDRLVGKESNRLLAMQDNLVKMGVDFTIKGNRAFIKGCPILKGDFIVKTYNDHRIAMAMTIAASVASAPVTLDDYTVINKSYPTFFDDYKLLGGVISGIK